MREDSYQLPLSKSRLTARAFHAACAVLLLAWTAVKIHADTVVFAAGQGEYHTYRIPALIEATDGTLLAFAEGRAGSGADDGNIDLVLRRSVDRGATWNELQVVWDDGPNTCGNPCPVLEQSTGTLYLLATQNLGQDRESESIAGTSDGTRTVWVITSDDHGATWSQPREITAAAKREDWTWYATGPGNGIQLRSGPHAGRLVVPCDHIQRETRKYFSHVIGSDDQGATWKVLGVTPSDQVNECAVAELDDGSLLLNMQNYDRKTETRGESRSTDGGATWSPITHNSALPEPICQASLIAIDQGRTLLFSNPASASERVNLTVRRSRDGGRSWSRGVLVHDGPAAYSSLAALNANQGSTDDNRIAACLYEAGEQEPYESIRFRRLRREELGLDIDRLEAVEGWTELLEPGSLDGWHSQPGGSWTWEGDVLQGRNRKADERHGLLISDQTYRDFEAIVRFRVTAGDSGFFFRLEKTEDKIGIRGFQAEIDTTPEVGGLYETQGRGWVAKPDPETTIPIRERGGPWLEMRVLAIGDKVDVFVDGVQTAKLRDDPGTREGHLALQLHPKQDVEVDFQSVLIREIEAEEEASVIFGERGTSVP